MNREDLAEPPTGAEERNRVFTLKVLDRHDAPRVRIMADAGDGAEETSLTLFVKLAGVIVASIVLAFFVTQVVDISSSLAAVLVIAYAALLSYGVIEWVRNPRA